MNPNAHCRGPLSFLRTLTLFLSNVLLTLAIQVKRNLRLITEQHVVYVSPHPIHNLTSRTVTSSRSFPPSSLPLFAPTWDILCGSFLCTSFCLIGISSMAINPIHSTSLFPSNDPNRHTNHCAFQQKRGLRHRRIPTSFLVDRDLFSQWTWRAGPC